MRAQQIATCLIGLVSVLTMLWFTGTWPFGTTEPDVDLPGDMTHETKLKMKFNTKKDPKSTICAAYTTLFAHSEIHRYSPPLLYTLFSIPLPPAQFSSKADRLAYSGSIVAGVSYKLTPLYEKRDTANVEAELAVWVELGAVLLDSVVREVYDAKVLARVRKKAPVREVLNGLCGKGWAKRNLKNSGE